MHPESPQPPPPPLSRRFLLLVAIVLIGGGGLLVGGLRWSAAHLPPRFESASFKVALQRWEQKGPENYDIEIVVTGNQPATYRVEVRRGEARQAFRNGHPLNQPRSFATWTVDGMFGTLGEDLARREQAQTQGKKVPFDLRVAYDPTLGYPAQYHRQESGFPVEVKWKVTEFNIINATSHLSSEE